MRFIKSMAIPLILISIAVILYSCSKKPTDSGKENERTAGFDGLWFGAFVVQPNQKMYMAFALIDPRGESFWGIYDTTYFDFNVNLHGTLKTENNLIKGNLDVLTINGKTDEQVQIYDGKMITTLYQGKNVRGLVAKFSGNAQVFSGSGDLSMTADDPDYFRASDLDSVTGTWSLIEEDGITTIIIARTGKITGGTNWGAQFSGSIELINAARNLYRIRSFNISGADQPYDGAYHGLATVLNQTLIVVCVKNDGSFMWGDGFDRE